MPGNDAFATRVAEAGGWPLGQIEARRFPDGERYIRLASDVAGHDVVLICSLAQPDPQLAGLIFAADAARDLDVEQEFKESVAVGAALPDATYDSAFGDDDLDIPDFLK